MAKQASKNIATETAALFLVARAGRPITLEAEVASAQQCKFVRNYGKWTGHETSWSTLSRRGHVVSCGSGKWGAECRIYFPTDAAVGAQLERYGYAVESGGVRQPGTSRVNSNHLFRVLVEKHGLRLGSNI